MSLPTKSVCLETISLKDLTSLPKFKDKKLKVCSPINQSSELNRECILNYDPINEFDLNLNCSRKQNADLQFKCKYGSKITFVFILYKSNCLTTSLFDL